MTKVMLVLAMMASQVAAQPRHQATRGTTATKRIRAALPEVRYAILNQQASDFIAVVERDRSRLFDCSSCGIMGPPCCELEILLDAPWQVSFRSPAELIHFLGIAAIYAPATVKAYLRKLASQPGTEEVVEHILQDPALAELL